MFEPSVWLRANKQPQKAKTSSSSVKKLDGKSLSIKRRFSKTMASVGRSSFYHVPWKKWKRTFRKGGFNECTAEFLAGAASGGAASSWGNPGNPSEDERDLKALLFVFDMIVPSHYERNCAVPLCFSGASVGWCCSCVVGQTNTVFYHKPGNCGAT